MLWNCLNFSDSQYSRTLLVRPSFFTKKVAFIKGWPLIRDINQYFPIKMYVTIWPMQRFHLTWYKGDAQKKNINSNTESILDKNKSVNSIAL